MKFDPGFDIRPTVQPMGFVYGTGVFGPQVEVRRLDAIRKSLRDPQCDGPDEVYAIAMDVGREEDREAMLQRDLLYGAVTYASGRLGQEPVRSQGHIHAVSACGMSTPEVYEIWSGRAVIYMQERDTDDPGRCFAVYAEPGEVVIVPPGWAHATISADPEQPLTFGAWCVQDYGFVYDGVRAHGGMAYYPLLNEDGSLRWLRNEAYDAPEIILKRPEPYAQLGLEKGVSIYEQFMRDHDRFLFVPQPMRAKDVWEGFVP